MRVFNSLKFKYVFLAILSLLIAGVASYYLITSGVSSLILETDRQEASSQIHQIAQKYIDSSRHESLRSNTENQNLIKDLSAQNFQKIRIIDPNGIVVSSENNSEIGVSYLNHQNVHRAIGGENMLSDVEREKQTALISVPIKNSEGLVRGVILAEMKIDGQIKNTSSLALQITLTLEAIVLFFVILKYFLIATTEDKITQQNRSILDKSKALEEEEMLDEAIMSSTAEALVVINKNGQIVLFNNEAEKLIGLTESDVMYRLYRKIIKLTDREGRDYKPNPISTCFEEGNTVKLKIKDEIYLKDSKNKLTPASVSVAPITDQEQKITGVVATITDISTEKELDKIKDEFVYVVAHELGNPIFALDGYLSVLETTVKKTDKKLLEIVHSAQGVHGQLSGLVNDLIEAIRNENNQLKLDLTNINLGKLTEEVVGSSNFKARTKKIKIEYTAETIPEVLGNEQKIREVLTNLIDNAIKYTPEGGKIGVQNEISGDMVTTHVKDNGYGIGAKDMERLFEKFYRIKNTNTQNIAGTGLGLFICRQIIEKCGGKIWAESEENKGSVFSFSLRVAKKSKS